MRPPSLSRRRWLTLAGSSALVGGPSALGRNLPPKLRGCHLGFGSYGLPGFSILDSIDLMKQIGYDSLELVSIPGFHGAPNKVPTKLREEIRKRLADSGIKLGALMGLPRPSADKKQQAASLEELKNTLELAVTLSPDDHPLIQGILTGAKWNEVKNIQRDCLGAWTALAAKANVALSIKPHRGQGFSKPSQGVWLIDQLKAKDKLTITFDLSHYILRDDINIVDEVNLAYPYVGYIVVKDAVKEANGRIRFDLPGSGEMPHADILKSFYLSGYRGEISVEVSGQVWNQKGYDPKKGATTSFKNMQGILKAAGIPRIR